MGANKRICNRDKSYLPLKIGNSTFVWHLNSKNQWSSTFNKLFRKFYKFLSTKAVFSKEVLNNMPKMLWKMDGSFKLVSWHPLKTLQSVSKSAKLCYRMLTNSHLSNWETCKSFAFSQLNDFWSMSRCWMTLCTGRRKMRRGGASAFSHIRFTRAFCLSKLNKNCYLLCFD